MKFEVTLLPKGKQFEVWTVEDVQEVLEALGVDIAFEIEDIEELEE